MRPGSADSHELNLRAGDLVEVRHPEEILATLDRNARLDAPPFMPEMFQYCGKRYRVFKRADKTCDTISDTGTRRLFDTAHLEGLRCDDRAHGGRRPLYLLFWKDAWLRRVPSPSHALPTEAQASKPIPTPSTLRAVERCTVETLFAPTPAPGSPGPPARGERFSCQAPELLRTILPLAGRDVRQYASDVRSGNIRIPNLLRDVAPGVFNTIQPCRPATTFPYLQGPLTPTPAGTLDLRPGALVRYCGPTFRLPARAERIIHDRAGTMVSLPNDCIVLERTTCLADSSVTPNRLYCHCSIYPFWREIWPEPIAPPASPAASSFGDTP